MRTCRKDNSRRQREHLPRQVRRGLKQVGWAKAVKLFLPDCTPPSAAKTYAKVVDGRPLTGADEDAVLFDDLLKE